MPDVKLIPEEEEQLFQQAKKFADDARREQEFTANAYFLKNAVVNDVSNAEIDKEISKIEESVPQAVVIDQDAAAENMDFELQGLVDDKQAIADVEPEKQQEKAVEADVKNAGKEVVL